MTNGVTDGKHAMEILWKVAAALLMLSATAAFSVGAYFFSTVNNNVSALTITVSDLKTEIAVLNERMNGQDEVRKRLSSLEVSVTNNTRDIAILNSQLNKRSP